MTSCRTITSFCLMLHLLAALSTSAQRLTVDELALPAQGGRLFITSDAVTGSHRLILPSNPGQAGDVLSVASRTGTTCSLTWSSSAAWLTNGNATSDAWNGSGGSFLGTTQAQPLVIATTNVIAQPVRFFTGPSGTLMSFEVGSYGDISIPVRVGIGSGVGASVLERLRLASIPETGSGAVVDLVGTSQATGLRVQRIGASGTDHAGIVLSAASNGSGTGIRIGGPSGAGRPTLGTGIDITGGTGLRYTALTAGVGTALEIGSTLSPLRGLDVTASGTEHVAGFFRSNLNGAGLIGISMSGAYTDPLHIPRVGVRGYAASNATSVLDTIVGVLGHVVRGGSGGTNVTSYGISGVAEHVGTSHAGLAIGVAGSATTSAPGTRGSIGGVFRGAAGPTTLALAVTGGADVYLGSVDDDRPAGFPTSFRAGLGSGNLNTTYMHSARISGELMLRGAQGALTALRGAAGTATSTLLLPPPPTAAGERLTVQQITAGVAHLAWTSAVSITEGGEVEIPAATNVIVTPSASGHVSCEGLGAGATVGGITGGTDGRIVILTMMGGEVVVANESPLAAPQDRIVTMTGADVAIVDDGAVILWYQLSRQRWLVLSAQL